jgi:PIN domain nuclease of toxin-antitoxin system
MPKPTPGRGIISRYDDAAMNVVVDASAVLALLKGEAIPDEHMSRIPGATISSLNLCEVVSKQTVAGVDESAIRRALTLLNLRVAAFNGERAIRAGLLINATSPFGLSMGDRACVALGAELGWPVLTADRAWERLPLSDFDIVMIR